MSHPQKSAHTWRLGLPLLRSTPCPLAAVAAAAVAAPLRGDCGWPDLGRPFACVPSASLARLASCASPEAPAQTSRPKHHRQTKPPTISNRWPLLSIEDCHCR